MCLRVNCRRNRRWFAVRGILHKGTLTRNTWCSRHRQISETDISTPTAVDQRAANCLEEAVRSSPPCRGGANRHTLTSPSAVHF
ncbi:hypothetical protein TNCV_152021 [Trichonephila clavipes]|uniref:Uncharacterized protein n=1 Tax=Trichonephila clavipes TaxID=2585209 RepID=A0A8X6RKU0_TRICX|nr:hypothetical protein TNCV_152021 [Trichonephila clavipes]